MAWHFELIVEQGKLRELASALHATDPRFASEALPTFPAVINHWGGSNREQLIALGFDADRVLHGEERYRYANGPLRAGDRLTGETTLVSDERKRGRRFATFRTELSDDSGVRVTIERVVIEP
jgi:acyl dehydratase